MKQNKTSKYLKYAIGEIILVVIGILLALQINTWNENRMLLKKETYYLQEIVRNLEADSSSIQGIFEFNKIKDVTLNETIAPLLAYESDNDIVEVIAKNFEANSIYNLFQQNNVGYDNMIQAENIGLVQDDALRQQLTQYYGQEEELNTGTAMRIKVLTREYSDISTNLILNKSTIIQILGKENNWPLDIELSRASKTELLSYLINIKDNISYYNSRLKRTQKEAKDLRMAINNYLKK